MSNTNNVGLYAQVDETVYDHPKTTRVVRAIRIDRIKLVGHLSALWNWSIKNRPDGDLSDLTRRDISDAARYTNADDFSDEADAKADAFVAALIDARTHADGDGFLETDGKGVYIHDWHKYGGKLNDRRLRNAFAAWIYRASKIDISIPSNDDTYQEWLSGDKEALKERYKNGGNKPSPKNGARKNDDTTPSNSSSLPSSPRHNDAPTPSPSNRTKQSGAERSVTEQSKEERSGKEQHHSKEEQNAGEGFDTVDEPGVVGASSQSEGDSRSVLFPSDLVVRLVTGGLSEGAARKFAAECPAECERQLDYLPYVTQPFREGQGAYLRRAIEQRYTPPKGYTDSEERAKNAETARQQSQLRQAQDRERQEVRKAEDARYASLLAEAQADGEQWKAIQTAAREALPPAVREKLDQGVGFVKASFDHQVRKIIMDNHGTTSLSQYSAQNTLVDSGELRDNPVPA